MANWKFFLDGNEVEEPIGWDAIEFTAIRMDSHGIDQPFSTEVRFYAEGARYIKSIYDQHFINQPIAITITSDVGYGNSSYQFDGFLNLAIYQEKNVCDTDSWEITVGIIDDNFREDFKARTDVEIDLTKTKDLNDSTINALAFRNIRMHRMPLYLTATGKNYADNTGYAEFDSIPAVRAALSVPTYWSQSDLKEAYGSTLNTAVIQIIGETNFASGAIFVNNQSVTRTIEYEIKVSFDGQRYLGTANAETLELRISEHAGTTFISKIVLYTVSLGFNQTFSNLNATFTGSFNCPPGHTISLQFVALGVGVKWGANITTYEGYTITLNEINEGEFASTSDVLTIEQWLRRCIYVMTGSNNKLLSDTFSESGNGCEWSYALTNGIRIRNNTTEAGTQLMTSWKKTFEDLDKIFCLGWAFEWTGSEWKIRVETRDYFYQNLVSQSFANVGEVVQAAKVDMLMNNITTGYTDRWKNIQISGVYAVHTERNYFIQNKAMNENSSAKLDLRSNIIAEGYAIEFYRRMSDITFGAASSDRPNDNETFIIWLNRIEFTIPTIQTSKYNLPEETGSVTIAPGTASLSSFYGCNVSGDILDHRYNFAITPARIAYRWWKWVGMFTYKTPDDIVWNAPKLQFQVGQYFTNIEIGIITGYDCNIFALPEQGIKENDSVSPFFLDEPYKDYLLRPIEVTFSYPQSLCDFLTLSQDEQYKKVRLTSGSLVIEGFITSATNQPEDASGGTTQFTLLYSNLQSELGGAFDEGFDDGYDNGG
jgi:hypothetical protein